MNSVAAFPWRPVTLADVPAMTVLLAEIARADRNDRHLDAAFLARWLDDPMIDLDRGTLAAFDGDRMVATGSLASRYEADPVHDMRYEGGVHPAYRGRGLGGALLDWAARAAGPLHAARFPGRPLRLMYGVRASDDATAELFARHGFEPVRRSHTMARGLAPGSLPELRAPEGFEIVPYPVELDDQVRVAKNVAFRDHWGVLPTLPEVWRSRFTGPDFQAGLSPVALDPAGEVVAMIITHLRTVDGRRDARVVNVGTVPRARGRGVASALLATTLRAAHEQGFDTASLNVDAENPTGALGVYEKSGFEIVDTWVTHARDLSPAAVPDET